MKWAKAGAEQPSRLHVMVSVKIKDNSMPLWGKVQFLPQMHQKLFGGQAPDPLGELTLLPHTL